MKWLSKFSQSSNCVGLEISSDCMNLAYRDCKAGTVHQVASLYLDGTPSSAETKAELLQNFVDTHSLDNATCNLVLPSSEYQLLLLERPEVADAEIREAVKWKVKDLIQEPIESVVIETFALPQAASKGRSMIYVVVAARHSLQQQIELIHQSNLKLNAIDIDVLTLRNLVSLKGLERSTAVVRLAENQGDVSIYSGDELYLSRHFNLNYGGGLLDELPSGDLALELQRSFDYFERQMGQVPPSVVFLCGLGVAPEKISDEFKRSIAAKVEYFDLTKELGISTHQPLEKNDGAVEEDPAEFDEGILQLCIAALGSTYRVEAS